MTTDNYYPFVSRKAQLEFYLLQTDGKTRCEGLGITERMYENKAEAKVWYDTLRDELIVNTESAASLKLKNIYDVMTYEYPNETSR